MTDPELPGPPCTQTMIRLLVDESPLHAWTANSKLNPNYVPEVSKEMDLGNIVHAILLKGEDVAERIDYNDYRTEKARDLRDQIREAGKYPILQKDVSRVDNMVAAARLQLPLYSDIRGGFVDGYPEHTIEWLDQETGVYCKARLDFLQNDYRVILDYKTTTGSAHPESVARALFDRGYDIQGVFYMRAVEQCMSSTAEFYLVTQESAEPYALSVVGLAPDAKWYGKLRCERGLKLWKTCLDSGNWPGYLRQTAWAQLPAWLEKRETEIEMRETGYGGV